MVVPVPSAPPGPTVPPAAAAPSSPANPPAAAAHTAVRSALPATVPSPRRRQAAAAVPSVSGHPGGRIETRPVPPGGVIITVCGELGRNGSAVLSRHLHAALDSAPKVVVVNLRAVTATDRCATEVLAVARERARAANTALHVVGPDHQLINDHVPAEPMR